MTPEERAQRAIGEWVAGMAANGRLVGLEGSVMMEDLIADAIRAAENDALERAAASLGYHDDASDIIRAMKHVADTPTP